MPLLLLIAVCICTLLERQTAALSVWSYKHHHHITHHTERKEEGKEGYSGLITNNSPVVIIVT